jgi:hypothetical protein
MAMRRWDGVRQFGVARPRERPDDERRNDVDKKDRQNPHRDRRQPYHCPVVEHDLPFLTIRNW